VCNNLMVVHIFAFMRQETRSWFSKQKSRKVGNQESRKEGAFVCRYCQKEVIADEENRGEKDSRDGTREKGRRGAQSFQIHQCERAHARWTTSRLPFLSAEPPWFCHRPEFVTKRSQPWKLCSLCNRSMLREGLSKQPTNGPSSFVLRRIIEIAYGAEQIYR